jgi:hypothetical protein
MKIKKTINKDDICKLKCPVCGGPMEREEKWQEKWEERVCRTDYEDSGVQSFTCTNQTCLVKWTAWDLKLVKG